MGFGVENHTRPALVGLRSHNTTSMYIQPHRGPLCGTMEHSTCFNTDLPTTMRPDNAYGGKRLKDPSYGDGPAFFVKYRIVPLEWWSNGTTLENSHAHVHLKGKLASFAFHCRCTSAHRANPSPAYVFL